MLFDFVRIVYACSIGDCLHVNGTCHTCDLVCCSLVRRAWLGHDCPPAFKHLFTIVSNRGIGCSIVYVLSYNHMNKKVVMDLQRHAVPRCGETVVKKYIVPDHVLFAHVRPKIS